MISSRRYKKEGGKQGEELYFSFWKGAEYILIDVERVHTGIGQRKERRKGAFIKN